MAQEKEDLIKTSLIIFILFFLVSCGVPKKPDFRGVVVTNELLAPYVDDFLSIAENCFKLRKVTPNVRIAFVPQASLPRDDKRGTFTIGQCRAYEGIQGDVYIGLETFRDVLLPYQRQVLIFHELAHCFYSIEHTKTENEIMSELNSVDYYDYVNNFQGYIERMFNQESSCALQYDESLYL